MSIKYGGYRRNGTKPLLCVVVTLIQIASIQNEFMYFEFKESTQRFSTKKFRKTIHAKHSHKLFDKVQFFVFKMILMIK